MKQKYFKKYVLSGELERASTVFDTMSANEQSKTLFRLAYDSLDISFYSFILMKLLKEETNWLHHQAVILLMICLCYEGWDALATYHCMRARNLYPEDIKWKQLALSFYKDCPEQFLTKKEALQIIQEILILDFNNEYVVNVIKEINDCPRDITIDDKDFEKLIYYGRYEEARFLVSELTQDQLFEKLIKIKPIYTLYGYVVNLLLEQENSVFHQLASKILLKFPDFIKGAYASAYWHAKRAVQLAPQDIEFKLWLLKFKALPGNLLSNDDAIQLAQSIIDIDPGNKEALITLKARS